jgi:hypothetical protein
MRRWAVALVLATLLAASSVASGQDDNQVAAPEVGGAAGADQATDPSLTAGAGADPGQYSPPRDHVGSADALGC